MSAPKNLRTTREANTRDNTKKPETYAPPPLLPMPPPEDGYVFKYIRKSTLGQIDTRNMARRAQQGWQMCRKEQYPDIAKIIDPFGNTGDYIESGGLVLAKLSLETANGIRLHNIRQAKAQSRAVDNNYFSLKDRGVEVFRDPESRTYTDKRG